MASVIVSSTKPVYFGNDPNGWRHGDWITVSARGTVVGSRWIRMTDWLGNPLGAIAYVVLEFFLAPRRSNS
ncbi:hypothetical protein ACIBM3_32915 [Rhodococcus erythropolis]|uniref:hypothetical protein n=1 Tax=Rhodococcus erythropolis TaxID=1833 RepID=UPI0037BCC488